MIPVSGGVRVYIATRPVDFRKGHDGLAENGGAKVDHGSGVMVALRAE